MSRSATQAVKAISVLWMDDKPDSIKKLQRALRLGQNRIEIEIVSSIEETRFRLEKDLSAYDLLIVDCKMDDDDDSVNGAEFLVEVNQNYKALPTFVYSAFWSDIPFKKYVESSYAIMVEGRKVYSPPLEENEFFAKIRETGERYLSVKHLRPEEIQFDEFVNNPSKYDQAVRAHRIKHSNWVRIEMRRKSWVWSVVCGESMVGGDPDLFKLPNSEALRAIGREQNRVPFVYSDPLPIESIMPSASSDIVWNTTRFANDFYPTIRASFGSDFVTDDFDTGATQTIISNRLVKTDEFDIWEEHSHFGFKYRYVQKKITLVLVDSEGKAQARELPVRV